MAKIKELFAPYWGLPKEIYIIFISRVVNALGAFVSPLLTFILTKNVGLSNEVAGLYMSLSGILQLPASILGGKLADIIGRKKIVIFSYVMAGFIYLICGFVKPSMLLVYLIMFAGALLTTAGPALNSLIADLTTPENRKGAYSLTYMGWNLGFSVGAFVGGVLYNDHLPLIFIGNAVAIFISITLVAIFVKETLHITEEDITDQNRIWEKREEGSIFSVLSKRHILIYFALINFGYNFVYSQFGFMMPLHSDLNFFENGTSYYGMMASLNGIVVILFTPIITKLVSNTQYLRLMVHGGLLYTIGFGMLGILNTLPFFFVSIFIITIGEIVLSISTSPFISNHTPASHRGRMNAVLPIIFGLGHTLGPLGMGKFLSQYSIELGWIFVGMVGLISSVLMYALGKYEKKNNLHDISEIIS